MCLSKISLLIELCMYTSNINDYHQQNNLTMLRRGGNTQVFGQKVAPSWIPGVFTLICKQYTSSGLYPKWNFQIRIVLFSDQLI